MGEVNTAPEVAAKAVEDLTAMEVDPEKGERLFKAAIIQSNKGATYRMLSKSLKTGKIDLVHYGCDLDEEGKPTTKWSIRRILEQVPERVDKEIAAIQKTIKDGGGEREGLREHDMTGMPAPGAQGRNLEEGTKEMPQQVRHKAR